MFEGETQFLENLLSSKCGRRLFSNLKCVNPIPAGVLENQDMLGGGQFDPPSKSHVLCPNITNESLESSCALLLESAKKLQICKN